MRSGAAGGALVVTTPNRLTFSPDGVVRNPFHTFEFAPADLRSALERRFAVDDMLGVFHGPKIRWWERRHRESLTERLIREPVPSGPINCAGSSTTSTRTTSRSARTTSIAASIWSPSLDLDPLPRRADGPFALVSHTHLPYLRKHGVWPVGEDLFHQAAVESYLPLLEVIERLDADGIRDAFTLGLSPMIATQLADPYLLDELGGTSAHSKREPGGPPPTTGDVTTPMILRRCTWTRSVRSRAGTRSGGRARADQLDRLRAQHGDLARAFASHTGVIELLSGPATNSAAATDQRPCVAAPAAVRGLDAEPALTGRRPNAIWLPECHFAPEQGLEASFTALDVQHLVLDGPTVSSRSGAARRSSRGGSRAARPVAFARDLEVTYRVWLPTGGHPSGKWYRDLFYFYDLEGGFKDWRVTGLTKPLHEKQPYDPEAARAAGDR